MFVYNVGICFSVFKKWMDAVWVEYSCWNIIWLLRIHERDKYDLLSFHLPRDYLQDSICIVTPIVLHHFRSRQLRTESQVQPRNRVTPNLLPAMPMFIASASRLLKLAGRWVMVLRIATGSLELPAGNFAFEVSCKQNT